MKLWCEECNGEGEVEEGFSLISCSLCNGKGYRVDPVVERRLKLGQAVEKLFGKVCELRGIKYAKKFLNTGVYCRPEDEDIVFQEEDELIEWFTQGD